MPPAALASLAKKAGKSKGDAERYYKDAKKQFVKKKGKDLKGNDFRLIMGIVKKRLGLSTKPLAASQLDTMIHMVTEGANPDHVMGHFREDESRVRAFYDSGILCFATTDDVMIEAGVDSRLDAISVLLNNIEWPHDHPIHDALDGFEGTIEEMYSKIDRLLDNN